MKRTLLILIVLSMMLSSSFLVLSAPEGVNIISNTTDTKNASPVSSLTTAGGSFTTMLLNGTFQNTRWKAFVGNISGSMTLDDSSNQTIYDWDLAIITGEVYASRSNNVDWANIACLDDTILGTEEAAINFDTTKVDSINNTFNDTVHAQFMVAGTTIANSTCRSIATFTNDARQAVSEAADFQLIALDDDSVAVYATLLENNEVGYDGNPFDFQMIVPDDETSGTDTPYYFYAELG